MEDVIDLKEELISLKAEEGIIAFAGFVVNPGEDIPPKEGILKFSTYYGKSGVDQLTLTFIVDTKNNQQMESYLSELFDSLSEDAIKAHLQEEIDAVVKVPVGSMADIKDWYIQELNFYRRSLQGCEQHLLEKVLIPFLTSLLSFNFGEIEWFSPGQKDAEECALPTRGDLPQPDSMTRLLRKLFGKS
ncbi:MAG: hypothetical protein JRJ12_15955 [Deltaproteobacteria bacterium]|nr:hypothetical protein [Deltaproteobacteria bacterium]